MTKYQEHGGQVTLINNQYNDLMIVNAARVSFNKESKEITDKDIGLINYLNKHNHYTPFCHNIYKFDIVIKDLDRLLQDKYLQAGIKIDRVVTKYSKAKPAQLILHASLWAIKRLIEHDYLYEADKAALINALIDHVPHAISVFGYHYSPNVEPLKIEPSKDYYTLRIKAPIFIARQWFKHIVDVVRNEISRRYVDYEPEFWQVHEWRGKPTDGAKQGSVGVVEYEPLTTFEVERYYEIDFNTADIEKLSKELYHAAVQYYKVCPEQARMVLPQSMMTEWIETGSKDYYERALGLRLESSTQLETQWLAEDVREVIGV